jgi:non-heme chloroperoxidase
MNRRSLMKLAASNALSACLLAGMTDHAMNAHAATLPATPRLADFVDVADRVRLAFTDWGNGKPVVFIHAWALPSPMWDYQIGALASQGLRCIAYDRRGHGWSSKPGSGYDCDTLADDLSALLTQLDLHEVTLVSHSFGSAEVVRYLTRHGAGRIAKIVLIAPAALPFVMKTADNPNGIPEEQLEVFRSKVLQADFPKWLEDGKKAFFVAETSPSLQDWVKALMLTTPLPVALETNRRVTATDFRKELPGIYRCRR